VTVYELPADLPVPVDDGACDHLEGLEVHGLQVFPPDRNAEEVLAWLGS
jgi:hypothetical protein